MLVENDKLIVCFVSPHPDDIELYCGGTLLDYAQRKECLSIIMMTNGGRGHNNPFRRGEALEQIRMQEARARYNLLCDVKLLFAGFKDAHVIHNDESILKVTSILKALNPDVIYCPEFIPALSERRHRDHLNTGKIIADACRLLHRPVTLRCYHSKSINYLHSIENYFEENNEAIKFYKSQRGLSIGPFMTGLTRLNHRYNQKRRKWGKELGVGYAEGFRETDKI